MPRLNESVNSFDEFFAPSKTVNDNDDKKTKQNDISPTSAVAALIKSQPVVHRRPTPSEIKSNINSKKMPLTTTVKNTPEKSKPIESPPSKTYESDFDENTSIDEKKKHSSLPPPKQRTPEIHDRDDKAKLRGSYTITNHNTRRKERILPYIRPKVRTKRLQKEVKNEVEQRLLSAENDKANQLQSRLIELRRQLENERKENKTLLTIQKREEKAIQNYEDQEYDVHRVARDYTKEVEDVKEKIISEREIKLKLEKEIEDRDEILRDQTTRMRFYEKLVYEPNLHEPDQLREKLDETEKELKIYEEKIANKEKEIQNLEKNYRHEILEELVKQRDLKLKIANDSKKYNDLLLRFEEKTRKLGTMHIYIQRGGRRPSMSSLLRLSKSRSLQSFQDTSPRLREKIQEYDKKRREEIKLRPKPKLKPLPIDPLPKLERKKYIPIIIPKPKPKPKVIKTSTVPIHDEKPPIIETEHFTPKGRPPVRRLSTPSSSNEDKSEIEDEIIVQSTRQKSSSPSPSPPPIPTRPIQHISQTPVHKRPLTPVSPPFEPKLDAGERTTANLFKHTEPPLVTRNFDDKWPDIFDIDKKEDSTKNDLLAKLISDEQQERKIVTTTKPSSPPSSQRASMIMFEPSSLSTNVNQYKPPTRIPTTNVYDFDQTIINLHEGKPVTTQPTTTKKSDDLFESLFDNNTTKSARRMSHRDDTFTTTQENTDPFDSIFNQSLSAANTSITIKPNLRQLPSQNDKLQRPKVVTNASRPIPNRTVVEEIEEIVL